MDGPLWFKTGAWLLLAALIFDPGAGRAAAATPRLAGPRPEPALDTASHTEAVVDGNKPVGSLPPALPTSAEISPVMEFPTSPATGPLDDLSLFLGPDGSKGPEDLGINANFGLRAAVNWGYPLLERQGLGLQLGAAINYAHTAVAVLEVIDGTRDRKQGFFTVGLFQRTESGLSWGVGYDILTERYYDDFTLSQWRGQLGYALGPNDEVGVWGATGSREANAAVAGLGFRLKPIMQGNLYWRHTWVNQAVTRVWFGVAEQHDRFVLVLPPRPAVHHPLVFGADLYVPLNDCLALFGEANFITPNDSGTVTATLGVAFYPSGRAWSIARSRFAPLLPVANNPTFAVDLER